jgi:hypothetical protein
MPTSWIQPQITNAFVECKKNPALCMGGSYHLRISLALKTFIHNAVRIVPKRCEIAHQVERHVLVKFEFHETRSGTNCSSCASSAA